MFKKALALTSFGAGYVLGARAGRERYEQIRNLVLRIKDDPHVQHGLDEAAEFAKQHTGLGQTSTTLPSAAEPFMPHQSAGIR